MDVSLNTIYRNKNENAFICFFFFILLTLVLLSSNSYISEYITLLLLCLIAICTVSLKNLILFFNFFLISIITSKLIAYQYLISNNSYFASGGDDQIFNDLAINFSKTPISLDNPDFLIPSYKLYIIILSTWVRLLNFIYPQNIDYHFSLLMLNSFFGASSIVFIKKIFIYFNKFNNLSFIKRTIILFNPFILYYSSVLLREIVLLFFILVFFYFLFNTTSSLRKTFIIISIISIFLIRPTVTILLIISLFFYSFLHLKSRILKFFYFLILTIPIIFFIIPIVELISNRSLDNFSDDRIEFISNQSSSNSIGLLLIQSNSFIAKLILPIYILLSPIPPPIFLFNFTLTNILISFGSIINFISLIFLLQKCANLFTNKFIYISNYILQKKQLLIISIFTLSNMIMVSFSSSDYRHNFIIYPFLLLLTIPDGSFKKSQQNLYIIIFIMISIAIFSYLFYKNLS